MGTRAIISINRKPFVATHWDGYPDSLGADLSELNLKDQENLKKNIVEIAQKHSIDAVDTQDEIFKEEVLARFQKIADKTKGKYTVEQLQKLYYEENRVVQFGIMCSDDWPIGDVKHYDDFAEYQYDVTDGKLTFRELCGQWSEQEQKNYQMKPFVLQDSTS